MSFVVDCTVCFVFVGGSGAGEGIAPRRVSKHTHHGALGGWWVLVFWGMAPRRASEHAHHGALGGCGYWCFGGWPHDVRQSTHIMGLCGDVGIGVFGDRPTTCVKAHTSWGFGGMVGIGDLGIAPRRASKHAHHGALGGVWALVSCGARVYVVTGETPVPQVGTQAARLSSDCSMSFNNRCAASYAGFNSNAR